MAPASSFMHVLTNDHWSTPMYVTSLWIPIIYIYIYIYIYTYIYIYIYIYTYIYVYIYLLCIYIVVSLSVRIVNEEVNLFYSSVNISI